MTEHHHTSAGSERALLANLVYEAMRFAIWAAGQGIMPDEGEPAQGPEDFLYEYSCAMEIDDWEGLAEVARDALLHPAQAASHPSAEAMKAAVELEIHAALGRVQTVEIGRMIQKAIDAAQPPAAPVETKTLPSQIAQRESARRFVAEHSSAGSGEEWNPTDEQVRSACMWYRHDMGLLTVSEAAAIKTEARLWLRAWQKEIAGIRAVPQEARKP